MTRRAVTATHACLVLLGAILYFLFVLPRWWVLTGQMPSTLATAGRIAAGLPIALAALPVVISLQRGLKPADHTPELALRLRAWSAVLHLVAGALILVAAVAEIWLGLGTAGPWLFGVYGAAAAVAVLGILAFHLSYRAEKPEAERKERKFRLPKLGKRGAAEAHADADTDAESAETTDDVAGTEIAATVGSPAKKSRRFGRKRAPRVDAGETTDIDVTEPDPAGDATTEAADTETDDIVDTETAEPVSAGGLRNKRPTGKSRHQLPR